MTINEIKNIKLLNTQLIVKFILSFFFLISIFSINSNSNQNDVKYIIYSNNFFNHTLLEYVIFFRFFLPFVLFFFLLSWFCKIKIKKNIFLILLILFNVWQLIMTTVVRKDFDIGDLQIVICSINLLLIVYIAFVKKLNILFIIFFYISLIFISFVALFFIYKIFSEFFKNNLFYYLYYAQTIIPETRDFNQAAIRSTGLGRILLLLLFFLFFIKDKFNSFRRSGIYLLLFIVSMLLYGTQARGALIGIPIIIFYYFLFFKEKILKKLTVVFFVFAIPAFTFENLKNLNNEYV